MINLAWLLLLLFVPHDQCMLSACQSACTVHAWYGVRPSLIHLNLHLSEWLYARNDLSRTCIAQCKNICVQDAGLQLFAPFCLCFCSCVFLTLCMHLYKCMYGPCNANYQTHSLARPDTHTYKHVFHIGQTRHAHKQTRRQINAKQCVADQTHTHTSRPDTHASRPDTHTHTSRHADM